MNEVFSPLAWGVLILTISTICLIVVEIDLRATRDKENRK